MTNIVLPDFSTCNILIIGDVMLDRYWHGNTERISPEAPVPIVHVKQIDERPGGASNVALNIRALGCNTTLLGCVGQDAAAKTLEKLLEKDGIKYDLQASQNIPTITKLRVISHNQQLIRLDFEEKEQNIEKKSLLSAYQARLPKTKLVIISDYGKGIASCLPQLITNARSMNIPVIVDPKGRDFSIYKGANLITPNLLEFETIVGACASESELEIKGLALIQDLQLEALLITRGAKGMSFISKELSLHMPTKAREIYDVTGAGDTVIAALGASLAAGIRMEEAIEIANTAAGIAVRKFGSATVSVQELRHDLRKHNESVLGIVEQEQLLHEVMEAKAQGETIVMTNGCFDIIHAGHIAYLEQAKALGTRLIVAINDDASISRLKGKNRPITPLKSRMEVMAGLRPVDWVISFSEDTPENLIKTITPNILVKGGDYEVDEIAGSDHVFANGGDVKSLAYIDNHSSSDIINKIREAGK